MREDVTKLEHQAKEQAANNLAAVRELRNQMNEQVKSGKGLRSRSAHGNRNRRRDCVTAVELKHGDSIAGSAGLKLKCYVDFVARRNRKRYC